MWFSQWQTWMYGREMILIFYFVRLWVKVFFCLLNFTSAIMSAFSFLSWKYFYLNLLLKSCMFIQVVVLYSFSSQNLEHGGSWISVSLRLSWSTLRVPGQSGLYRETFYSKQIQKTKHKKILSILVAIWNSYSETRLLVLWI